jgi:hypothetical protein
MPLLPDIWEKVKNRFTAAVGFFKGLAEKLQGPDFLGKLGIFLRENAQKLLGKIPEGKQRLILICGAGGLALLVFAGVLLANSGKEKQTAGIVVNRRIAIPSEEIFLPDEPDFVPGVLLERERRAGWTAADAAPYWQDPLKNGEEYWRERIEAVIDEFLENVP